MRKIPLDNDIEELPLGSAAIMPARQRDQYRMAATDMARFTDAGTNLINGNTLQRDCDSSPSRASQTGRSHHAGLGGIIGTG